MWRLWWCWLEVVAIIAPVAAVVGGGPASAPLPDDAVVFVQRHGLSARLEGNRDDKLGYYSFIGIRYAEPAVGPRRFQRPVRRHLAGELNATEHCSSCPQPDPYTSRKIIGNEDCLCLNVFAPKMPGDETGCPVIFFIHGGNYRSGSTASYGGQHLAQKDTILVTVQYRLGSLGYLSTGEKDASGNAGLFDLRAAMLWVNDYIEFFGGDRNRVVVMGHGSGGSAASLLALTDEGPVTRGVAALSGAPLSPGAVRPDPSQHARQLAARTRCPAEPAERLIGCLRTRSVEDIVEADRFLKMDLVDTEAFLSEISGRSGAGARVEGTDDLRGLPPLITDHPQQSIKNNKNLCPMLTGVTSAETSRAVFGTYSKFLSGKLNQVQDFIKKDVIGGLRTMVEAVPSLIPALPPGLSSQLPLAGFYQAVFDSTLNVVDGLTEIAEATGDALFNFPAYQSTRAWSENGRAYLYSFEHVGNLTKGSHFLPGLALTQNIGVSSLNQKAKKGPSHGDELAYLFEPLNDNGSPVSDQVSSTDARVRDYFVGLIAKFAHDLMPLQKKNTSTLLGFLPFSEENDQFLKIKEDGISFDKNFRFCQMGLWGNMLNRLNSGLCKAKISDILNLPKKIFPINLPLDPGQGSPGISPLLPIGRPGGSPILPVSGLLPLNDQSQTPSNNFLPNILGPRTQNAPKNRSPLGFLNKI